jgi:hypothetical protein
MIPARPKGRLRDLVEVINVVMAVERITKPLADKESQTLARRISQHESLRSPECFAAAAYITTTPVAECYSHRVVQISV